MHYGASTHLHPELVMSKAAEYFASLGLKDRKAVAQHSHHGEGEGQVAITLSLGSETEVDIVTHGYNQEVKAFLQRIG